MQRNQKYLQILQILQPTTLLTDTENKYLAFFIKERNDLSSVPEPHRSELLFSEKVRKKAKEVLNIKTSQANVLFASLRKKGVIKDTEEGYKLAELFNVINEDTIEIIYKINLINPNG